MENFHHITLYMANISTYLDIKPLKVENDFHVSSFFNLSIKFDIIMVNMESKEKFIPNQDLKLLEQVRETLRYYHKKKKRKRKGVKKGVKSALDFVKLLHVPDIL